MVSTLNQGARVLVTGATGYVGATVADQFIQAGHVVVGTSRTAHKAEAVKEYFDKKYGPGKFEIYESGDLEKEGCFDEAVKDVEAIAHVASPVTFNSEDAVRDVINPAINGTLSLLNSAHKYGKNVKSVVVTSSLVTLLNSEAEPGHIFTESDWYDAAFQQVLKLKEQEQPIDGFLAYVASKNEAERAVWKFRDEKKPSFTLSTILPAYVYGAILPPAKTLEAVKAASTAHFVIDFFDGTAQDPTLTLPPVSFVDVVDVARAHVKAVQLAEKANGQRYLLNAGPYDFQEAVDVLRKHFPERQNIIAKGQPGRYKNIPNEYDGSKVTRELGIQYNTFANAVLNTVNSVKHLY